jgi:hypothetical protein
MRSALVVLLVSIGVAAVRQEHLVFTDITTQSGITWRRNNGADGRKLLPESIGGGGAFLHADEDGRLDLLLVNARDWKRTQRKTVHGLFRNLGGGRFADIAARSGLDVEMYGMGAAVADYDNDGREDVYITGVGGDRLFHNEGRGRFSNVTARSGVLNDSFGVSAAWLDYDRDGLADLFVGNYVRWSSQTDVRCSYDGVSKGYCGPQPYSGIAPRLFRNLGEGRFADVTRRAGFEDPAHKALGVAVLDYDVDGWPDLFVANDLIPSRLYRNNRDGTFRDVGLSTGVAVSEDGVARSNMGTDAADYDRSGRPHVLVGNFANQMLGLYHNDGRVFVDEAPRSAVGRASLLLLTWAAFFFDYDLDGWLDIFTANGHIDETWTRLDPRVTFRQPLLLLRNLGGRSFENATTKVGPAVGHPRLARGAGYGDIDEDGDLDVFVTTMDGPVTLLRNDGGNRNHWWRLRAIGTKSNRSGLGAVVRVTSASGTQWQMVRSGSSYASQSELALTFGLGRDSVITRVEIAWPSGLQERFTDVAVDKMVIATEGKGLSAVDGYGVSRGR